MEHIKNFAIRSIIALVGFGFFIGYYSHDYITGRNFELNKVSKYIEECWNKDASVVINYISQEVKCLESHVK